MDHPKKLNFTHHATRRVSSRDVHEESASAAFVLSWIGSGHHSQVCADPEPQKTVHKYLADRQGLSTQFSERETTEKKQNTVRTQHAIRPHRNFRTIQCPQRRAGSVQHATSKSDAHPLQQEAALQITQKTVHIDSHGSSPPNPHQMYCSCYRSLICVLQAVTQARTCDSHFILTPFLARTSAHQG